MKRDALVHWLDNYLDIGSFQDPSLNGLQVEGAVEVVKVAVAVDSSLSTFEQAAELGADMLIVHHGLFWGEALAVTGTHKRRLELLFEQGINLYAAHLPLDAHKEVGNNWGLARILGLDELEDFGAWKGRAIGVKGRFPNPVNLRELADQIEQELGEAVLVHAGGEMELRSLGIISGSAAREVITAASEGLDALLTGEPKHDVFHEAFERRINALYAGHYMTETVGVKLLAERLENEFDLTTEFILLPTGL
jgi:dinuclear metal center YbgI/SA1388 family protein